MPRGDGGNGDASTLLHEATPTTALDPGQIHDIRNLIKELAAEELESGERRGVILSTHRLEDVVASCNRIIMIARGTIVSDEPIDSSTTGAELEERFLELTADAAPEGAGA